MTRLVFLLSLSFASFVSTSSFGFDNNWQESVVGSYQLVLNDDDIVDFDINENLEALVWSWGNQDIRTLAEGELIVKDEFPLLSYEISFTLAKTSFEKVLLSLRVIKNLDTGKFDLIHASTAALHEDQIKIPFNEAKLLKRIHRSGLQKIVPKMDLI